MADGADLPHRGCGGRRGGRHVDARAAEPAAARAVPDSDPATRSGGYDDDACYRAGHHPRGLTGGVSSRRASCVLDPDPVAAREAREFVTATCRAWQVTDDLDTVSLLTSELVTNGVLHARTPLEVGLVNDDRGLRVEVHDRDPRPPSPRGHRLNLLADIDELLTKPEPAAYLVDERQASLQVGPAGAIGAGRGLLLVEALADEWGVELAAQGKAVWFRLLAG
jgi:hypothetical protein